MCFRALTILVMLVQTLLGAEARGDAFLVDKKGLRSGARQEDAGSFKAEIRDAMDEALGCGGEVSEEHLKRIEEELKPMYVTLPKNHADRLERRSLRYLGFRYFHRRSAVSVRGFEPTHAVNDSSWGAAAILSEQVPGYVESVLESAHATEHGFDLRDAALMVATLEQLIFDSETTVLQKIYELQHKPLHRALSQQGLQQLLEAYMAVWMAGDEIIPLLSRPKDLDQVFPHWGQLIKFAHGQIDALNYKRAKDPKAAASGHGHTGGNAMSPRYSFDDAHAVVGGITRSFASFWESECREMKRKLSTLDRKRTGRVPLSKFYGKSLTDAEWRFGESESYLRELGALDETSWLGKQVIIPNYIQGASNCIVSASHYSVCCMNECEPIMAEIEEAVGSPMAETAQLLYLVGNMTSMFSVEDEVDIRLDASLISQLESIAAANGGQVPIHGRLFAQWLHYVFPRDCAFPHKAGGAQAISPSEYGDGYLASDSEMETHAKDTSAEIPLATMPREELHWMSQWSEEEELIASYDGLIAGSSKGEAFGSKFFVKLGFGLFVLAGLIGVVSFQRKVPNKDFLLPSASGKTHFV